MYTKYFGILKTIAEDVVPVSNCRLAAMLLHRGKIIAVGTNQYKSHPFAAKYSKNPHAIFLHAEADCINKAKKRITETELKKSTLIIARIKLDLNGNVHYGIAKPCDGCARCIEDHGIRKVIYTEESSAKSLKFTTEMFYA